MNKLTANVANKNFLDLLENVTKNKEKYEIEDNYGVAILIRQEEYENLLETIELLSIPGFRDSLKKSVQQITDGEIFSLEEVLGDIL